MVKIDRLIAQICDRTKAILSQCVLPYPDYGDANITAKQMQDVRNCLVGFTMICPCVERTNKCVGKMKELLEKINGIPTGSHFNERVIKVNEIMHVHSGVNPDGLVSILEELYYLIGKFMLSQN